MIAPRLWIVAGLCLGGCTPQAAVLSAPRVIAGHAAIEHEEVAIRCSGPRADVSCAVDAEYGMLAHGVPGVVVGTFKHNAGELEMSADAPVERWRVPKEQLADVAHDVAERDFVFDRSLRPPPDRMEAFYLEHPAALTSLRTQVTLFPEERTLFRLDLPAPMARHRAMAHWLELEACMFDQGGCHFDVQYLPARPEDRAARHQVHVHASGEPGWSVTTSQPEDPDDPLLVSIATGEELASLGGPFFGYGARLDDGIVAKTRIGWEFFVPQHVAHALSFELDAEGRRTLGLTTELVSPSFLVLPSAGVGFGLPLRLSPDLMAGVRAQLSLQFPYVGAAAVFDLYPGARDEAERFEKSIYLQAAL
jgi:hypothetical protein